MAVDFYLDRSRSITSNSYLYDISSRSTSSTEKSPRYFGKLAKKECVIDRSWTTVRGSTCTWSITNKHGTATYAMGGGYITVPEPPYNRVAHAENVAFLDARDYAYGNLSNVQMKLWEYFVERRKILGTLIQRAHLLRDVIDAIRKKSLVPITTTRVRRYYNGRTKKWVTEQKTSTVNRTFSDLWLEYSFMWKPIMTDIETLYNGIDPTKPLFVTGVGRFNDTIVETEEQAIGLGATQLDHSSERIEVRCKVKLFVTIDDPLQAMLHEVGILNLAAPWDAAPYSFVIDWFFKVSHFLERICTPGKTITGGSTTWLTKASNHTWSTRQGLYSRDESGDVYYSSGGSGVKKHVTTYRRTVGVPSPWYIRTSRPDELWHAITSWALISQILHGSKPQRGRHFGAY